MDWQQRDLPVSDECLRPSGTSWYFQRELGTQEPNGQVKRPHKPELCLCLSVLHCDYAYVKKNDNISVTFDVVRSAVKSGGYCVAKTNPIINILAVRVLQHPLTLCSDPCSIKAHRPKNAVCAAETAGMVD